MPAIRSTARVPDQLACIDTMRDVKKMMSKLWAMLKGEHECIAVDGWTSCTNDTYLPLMIKPLTISLIISARKLFTLFGLKQIGGGKVRGCSCWQYRSDGCKACLAG